MNSTILFLLQALASVFLLYFALTSLLRFHQSMHRSLFLAFVYFTLCTLLFVKDDALTYFLFLGIGELILIVFTVVLSIKKKHALFLFHLYKPNTEVQRKILESAQERHLDIKFCSNFPFILLFEGISYLEFRKFQKQVDILYNQHVKPKFVVYYPWIIATFIILAAFWRY